MADAVRARPVAMAGIGGERAQRMIRADRIRAALESFVVRVNLLAVSFRAPAHR